MVVARGDPTVESSLVIIRLLPGPKVRRVHPSLDAEPRRQRAVLGGYVDAYCASGSK